MFFFLLPLLGISIHAPARGATYIALILLYLLCHFYPRSRKGSDQIRSKRNYCLRYFYPRSRKGSDLIHLFSIKEINISIHAPARGATPEPEQLELELYYFYPRSRKGSDARQILSVSIPRDFYPRSRKGSDIIYGQNPAIHRISIHAPARGATPEGKEGTSPQIFLSTLPQGERRYFDFMI
mgnify:CR=1 FL=1